MGSCRRGIVSGVATPPAVFLATLAAAIAQVHAAPVAEATAYPLRSIRFIVPFPPGGGNDVVGRIVAQKLQEALGQALVVDNRGGAGGTLGTAIAAKAPPDGYTLLINNISLAVNVTLFPKLPYDTLKDLAPVSIIARQPNVLVVSSGLKAKTVRELLDLARAKPGGIIYASGGQGSSSHLATERLQLATRTRMTHVPYKGLAQATTDLMGGRVDMIIATMSTALAPVKGGKVRALAVTSARRTSFLPEVPTMIEAGVPDFEVSTWYALIVPAATPTPIVARLNDELGKVARAAAVKEQLAALGVESVHSTPGEASAHIKAEVERWAAVVKASGARAE
jgi:tripartite-type tricarboxylate transporter receptor subunit TctC